MRTNLRHLRLLLAVAETGSMSRAAALCHVTQPAVTQAITKLERLVGQTLFIRRSSGMFATPSGQALITRLRRAFDRLDPVLTELSPRLSLTVTTAQLDALIISTEAENFSLAARRMGLAQPTVHRAVAQLEKEAGRSLFERTAHGVIATRAAQTLAEAARLAFSELEQAEADLAELVGREVGRIVVGAMPLARSYLLPRTIARFRTRRPTLPVRALDGPYEDMMAGLRRGEVDFLIGALRDPAPIDDVEQIRLFDDTLVMVARPDHPLAGQPRLNAAALAHFPMVAAAERTPARYAFDRVFASVGGPSQSVLETGSMILMRELLRVSDHVGCISRLQVAAEIELGALCLLDLNLPETIRPIGLSQRRDWLPTRAQAEFLAELRAVIAEQSRS
ncbi:DNA-binding transcriptional regulator, LysR family [Paracoccus pantotrophus]|nr:DNA-binding transcriptional regulator, LysR family [Paracoccus pantotrophus]